ncbi:MAG TPA: hypothetical protein P5081_23055 [Phycisphaerae bacterium]|nr:hypothetical protein [Phycisphaerae bacterium]HRW55762.1 hypothetical protein [Phycisphaerae bacterium]
MKKSWIEFNDVFTRSPMSFWVHRPPKKTEWDDVFRPSEFDPGAFTPPLPRGVPGRGYPLLHVQFNEVVLRFASMAELDRMIDVLSRRKLPTTYEAQREEREPGDGLRNQHWLSRLPAALLSFSTREKVVSLLNQARGDFAKVAGCADCQD